MSAPPAAIGQYPVPRGAPEPPSTADDRRQQHPVDLTPTWTSDSRATHENTLVMRRSLGRDEDLAAEVPIVVGDRRRRDRFSNRRTCLAVNTSQPRQPKNTTRMEVCAIIRRCPLERSVTHTASRPRSTSSHVPFGQALPPRRRSVSMLIRLASQLVAGVMLQRTMVG